MWPRVLCRAAIARRWMAARARRTRRLPITTARSLSTESRNLALASTPPHKPRNPSRSLAISRATSDNLSRSLTISLATSHNLSQCLQCLQRLTSTPPHQKQSLTISHDLSTPPRKTTSDNLPQSLWQLLTVSHDLSSDLVLTSRISWSTAGSEHAIAEQSPAQPCTSSTLGRMRSGYA